MPKPGDKITPASFAVVPELLGRPLASPTRRATAMAIDLLLLAILTNAGAVFFGIAAAFALWRASAHAGFAARWPRLRQSLRIGAAFVLFLVVVTNWGFWTRPFHRVLDVQPSARSSENAGEDEDAQPHGLVVAGANGGNLNVRSIASAAALGGDFLGLRRAASREEADRVARRMVRRLKEQGASAADVRAVGKGMASDSGALPPVAAAALEAAIAAELPADSTPAAAANPDSITTAFVRAFRKGDTATLAQVRPQLATLLAADTLATLNNRVREAEKKNAKLVARVQGDSAKLAGGPAGLVDSVADAGGELLRVLRKAGLGFGWLGLYFTGFVAMMNGRTPGKWMMGIRIVRLDGRPMGWWAALERFGGYAASVVTALSGFFQILWDKNRQAMHDKIAETVVIRG